MSRAGDQPSLPTDAITVASYQDLDLYVDRVASGALDLLLIIGRHGTGKSERVRRMLAVRARSGAGPLYVEGHAQPFGIYRGLWDHRDQPVVLDDVDRLYANSDCVRLLKPLCESRLTKRVSWLTHATMNGSGPPSAFETKSPVILIANEWRSLNANVRALEDRAIIIHFDPTNDSVHAQARQWCRDEEIHQFIGAHLSAVQAVSMRWYAKAQKLREAGFRDWKVSLLQMMLSDRHLAIVAELALDPTYSTERDRIEAFARVTGRSRATYYRLRRRLSPSFRTTTICKAAS